MKKRDKDRDVLEPEARYLFCASLANLPRY